MTNRCHEEYNVGRHDYRTMFRVGKKGLGVWSEMQAALQRSGGQHTSSRRKSQGPGLGGNTLGMMEGRNATGLGLHMRTGRGVHGVGVSGP